MKVYTDEGISGTNTKHRIGFNEMIADAMSGKIDLIVTKSVSRFARNTVDSLVTIRKLKEKRVEVFFEKENIYTFDGKGELLLTIMSSLAQEESRSISENVTWGQRKRFADGKVSLPYAPYREAMTQMVRTVLALPYEDVWIRSDDGLHLHGKYYVGRPGAPVQIMMHGYKSGAERDFCGGAQIAVQGGYHVLLVDQRAHNKHLLVVPGAGHGLSYMVDREAYLAALESFLRSVLD